ncbi:MAG: hypothetical protein GX638_06760 [Crenarchaeota archaeon]|nr:hypothetical protein [Thermoproteota archaeon]
MYSTIVLDCQTKTDTPHCEDCLMKKMCLARMQRQPVNKKIQQTTNKPVMIEVLV